ncbi:hypothetical protein D3C81_1886730 [compost metagenome]
MGLMDRDYMRREKEEPELVAKLGPVRFVRGPVRPLRYSGLKAYVLGLVLGGVLVWVARAVWQGLRPFVGN